MKVKNNEKETMRIIEDVFGCKWTIRIIAEIRKGNRRPGSIRRVLEGLSEKVLNERLQKLLGHRMIERKQVSEKPLAVEYTLTSFGKRFLPILDAVKQAAHKGDSPRKRDRLYYVGGTVSKSAGLQ